MLSNKDDTLGTLVHEVAHLLRILIDRQVEPYNLTRVKWLALGVLDRRNGITQTELADYLELNKSTVGRLLDRLEQRGFITRESDPEDRRVSRIYIAETARPVLSELEEVAENVRTLAMAGLSDENRETLVALLMQVKKNLLTAKDQT